MAKRIGNLPLVDPINIRFAEHEYNLLRNWSFAEKKSMAAIVRSIVEEKLKGMEKVLTSAVIAATMKNSTEK